MKVIKTVYFVCFVILINISVVFANDPPANLPPPTAKSAGVASTNGLPLEPPGVPIDNNILILTMSALVFGTIVIYKNKKSFSVN